MRRSTLLLASVSAATLSPSSPPSPPPVCEPTSDGTVLLNFDAAEVKLSNLGGLGGNPGTMGHDGTANASLPPRMLLGGVARLADGTVVDLQIDNTSTYKPFKAFSNGVMQKSNGSFGLINMAGTTDGDDWLGEPSVLSLRYTFLDAATGAAVRVPHTFVSFYDLDMSGSGLIECLQLGERDAEDRSGGVDGGGYDERVFLSPATQLSVLTRNSTNSTLEEAQLPTSLAAALRDGSMPAYCSSESGTGRDNPVRYVSASLPFEPQAEIRASAPPSRPCLRLRVERLPPTRYDSQPIRPHHLLTD